MGCQCSTRWRQKDQYGTAKIKLGSSTISPSMPSSPPPPPVPMNIGAGSWAFVRDNPSLSISDGTSLSSNEHFASENYTGPFAVKGPCSGSGGSSCDCTNTNNGSGTLIDSIDDTPPSLNDSTLNSVTKSGKWVYTWNIGISTDGPEATETIPARVEHTVTVKLNKYCYEHNCPDGAGSSTTNDFGNLGSWVSDMIDAGNGLVSGASD